MTLRLYNEGYSQLGENLLSGICDNFPAFLLSEGRRHGTLGSIPTLLRPDSHLLTIM